VDTSRDLVDLARHERAAADGGDGTGVGELGRSAEANEGPLDRS